jgi:NAD(P)H-dependent FMN reductase
MPHIEIISASVRQGRNSHRVALFFKNQLEKEAGKSVNIQDLATLQFPIFEERLAFQKTVAPQVAAFASAIEKSDAVLIVTPEYNGGYPASLKNVIDLLYSQWYHKPIGIITVSDGDFGGSQVITSLVFTLWKMKASVITAQFPVPNVAATFNELGEANDLEKLQPRLQSFLNELNWAIQCSKA